MNCFMSYNPNVAHDVKVTTWIKEFDGASPVYPSFPNEGDVFIVFDNDEATEPSVNKTYTSGDWADTSSGSTPTGTIYITENGEGIDVSSYATADVNVSGGSSLITFHTITLSCSGSPDEGTAGILFIDGSSVVGEYSVAGFAVYNGDCVTVIENIPLLVENEPITIPFYLAPNASCIVMNQRQDEPIAVTGDAEIVEDSGSYSVLVSGDCSITFRGYR